MIKFMPVSEQYYPYPHQVYFCQFNLHFVHITVGLLDTSKIEHVNHVREELGMKDPDLAKRFILILTVGSKGWVWKTTDIYLEAEAEYKNCVTILKSGEPYEFKDISAEKNKPIKISWRALEFEW